MSKLSRREQVVSVAESLIGVTGVKYRHGRPDLGESPDTGFDCSGFVRYVLNKCDLTIPDFMANGALARPTRHANELWDTYGVAVHGSLAKPGDLVFFSRHGFWPTHVGILNGAASYVHSPGKDGSNVEVASIMHEQIDAIMPPGQIYRQLFDHNPIGFKSPTISYAPSYRVHQLVLE